MAMQLLAERFIRDNRGFITLRSFLTFAQSSATNVDTGVALVSSSPAGGVANKGGELRQDSEKSPNEQDLTRNAEDYLLDMRADASRGLGFRDPRELEVPVRIRA